MKVFGRFQISGFALAAVIVLVIVALFDGWTHKPADATASLQKLDAYAYSVHKRATSLMEAAQLRGADAPQALQEALARFVDRQAHPNAPSYYLYRQDSLMFWNHPNGWYTAHSISKQAHIVRTRNGLVYTASMYDHSNALRLMYAIPLSRHIDDRLTAYITDQAGLRHQLVLRPRPDGNFSIRGQTHPFHVAVDRPIVRRWRQAFIGFSYFLLTLIFLLSGFRQQRLRVNGSFRASALYALYGVGIQFAIALWAFFQRFPDIAFFAASDGPSSYSQSIANLCVFAWFSMLMSLLISRELAVRKHSKEIPTIMRLGVFTGLVAAMAGITHLIRYLIWRNSIPFDVDHIFDISVESISSVSAILLIVIAFFIVSYAAYRHIIAPGIRARQKAWMGVAAIAIVSIIFAFFQGIPWPFFVISVASFFLLLDLFIDTKRPSITWLIWWMIVVGGFVAMLLFKFQDDREKAAEWTFIQDQQQEVDPATIDRITALSNALGDSTLQHLVSIPYPFKIDRNDLIAFLTEQGTLREEDGLWSTTVYVYDRLGRSIIEDDVSIEMTFRQKSTYWKTIDTHLSFDPIRGEYVLRRSVQNPNHPASPFTFYFVIKTAASKQFDPYSGATSGKIDLAILHGDNVVESNSRALSEVVTQATWRAMSSQARQFNYDGHRYSVIRTSDGLSFVSRKKLAQLIKPISLFSYVFSLLGFIALILAVLNSSFHFLPAGIDINISQHASLRNRIQLSVVILIILSFVIIGVVTVYYFKTLSANYTQKEILDKTIAVISDIHAGIGRESTEYLADQRLREELSRIEFVHRLPISVYSPDGRYLFTSGLEPDAADTPNFIPFPMYLNLRYRQFGLDVQSIDDGLSRSLMRSYSPIYYDQSQLIGFASLPFYTEARSGINVNDFMGTLLNVYVFLFLIAGAIAIAVANSITYPISELGEKLRRVKLGKRNEVLDWKSRDELGALIDEYNNMIVKLDESASLLAKTERDTAWREMAKQVAHEIKNPLTPMKLSIQYLKKATSGQSEEAANRIQRVSDTLIEQIDNLSQIANEFSNFAKLPQARNEKIVLNEVVEAIHDLFRKREDLDMVMHEPIDELYVFADRNQLIRILNNIVKNAIQAIPNDRRGRIEIRLFKEQNKAVIQVSDNGVGIPADMQEKVFSPYFTTKSSGTGLGLAISANMIESCNGRIHFKTDVERGTDFFVEIPLMRLEDNYRDGLRVNLDDV